MSKRARNECIPPPFAIVNISESYYDVSPNPWRAFEDWTPWKRGPLKPVGPSSSGSHLIPHLVLRCYLLSPLYRCAYTPLLDLKPDCCVAPHFMHADWKCSSRSRCMAETAGTE